MNLDEPPGWLKPVCLNLAVSFKQCAVKGKYRGVDMKYRQRVVDAFTGLAKSD
jgi:hypothetical protein